MVLMTKNLIKNCAMKDFQATGEAFGPQKREHPALKNMLLIFLYFCVSFLLSRIRSPNPD
jgi:hypothetical protein